MNPIEARLFQLLRPNAAWLSLVAAIALTVIGVLAIDTNHEAYASKQLQWLFIAVAFALVCVIPHSRLIGVCSYALMVLTLLMLIFVIFPGVPRSIVPVRNGTTAWINLHFMMFQPAEVAKIGFVLALAWYLRHRDNFRSLRGLLIPFVIMIVPVMLILKQPDLGTAMLFGPALFAMLIAAGARLSHMSAIVGLGLAAIVINLAIVFYLPDSMQVLRPHQRQRIISMVSQVKGDTRYIKDIGYQQHKAVTLAGSGGAWGHGEARSSTIMKFNTLPEDHNDMIFAVIVNRWGLAGGITTLVLYLLMFGSFLIAAGRSRDPFARLVIVGFTAILFSQMLVNVGMSIGMLPIVGITLPFVSYGGSSLLATFAMIGLVLNFASRGAPIINRPAFEFDSPEHIAPRPGPLM